MLVHVVKGRFDKTKKVMCVMQVVGADKVGGESTKVHDHSFMGA